MFSNYDIDILTFEEGLFLENAFAIQESKKTSCIFDFERVPPAANGTSSSIESDGWCALHYTSMLQLENSSLVMRISLISSLV